MRSFLLAPLLTIAPVLGAAPPASLPPAPAPAPCGEPIRNLVAPLRTDATQISADGDGCLVTHLKLRRGIRFNWEIDRLHLAKAPGPGSLWLGLRAIARGIRFTPDISDAHAQYLIRNQQSPFDALIDYTIDTAAGTVQLKELRLESPALGRISASAEGVVSASSADLAGAKSAAAAFTNGQLADWQAFQHVRFAGLRHCTGAGRHFRCRSFICDRQR